MSIPMIRIAGLLAAALLTSCASLTGKSDPFAIYSPRLSAAPSTAGAPVAWQLAIDTPLTSSALDSNRIVVMPSPGVLQIYPAARWRDPAPQLLRGLVVEGFERSGRILGVGAATAGLHADIGLSIDLRAFQAEIDTGGARAVVRFQASLLDFATNRVFATRSFEASAPAASSDVAGLFPAFEAALDQVVPHLVDWTLAEGEKRRPPAAGP
ncbi:ABC-type transport auxiliary lipoprotein family protein [Dokdonella koreensis]|uniref:Lipoprotein n=1 Tax=Dokdonella koreensis DS-123 TaxID=1300342 RepID=A0A160DYI1_9GAMM|nr:ABC-type transport auxiliary lipoprotein family protein [Dokdonella koreensis]ANB19103.1 Putative lipoprotein [Dokdonella koreensis DS-123]